MLLRQEEFKLKYDPSQLDKLVEESMPELVSTLQGCIQIPSISQSDGVYPYGEGTCHCLNYVLERASELGFATCNVDNHVGWCEYGEGEEMVAVLCHLDVVPPGEGWTMPPYEGRIENGRIYGRGTMDDKGPAMAALYALSAVKRSGIRLGKRVRILFGLSEETGGGDIEYYLDHGGEVPVMGFTPDGEYPLINGEKGLVTETYTRTLHQTGGIRLTQLYGGTAHNIVPAHAHARLVCSPAVAEEILARRAEKITCSATSDGVLVEAEGLEAHGGTPQEGENAIGRLMLFLHTLPLEGEFKQSVALLAEKLGMETDGASIHAALSDELSGNLTMNMGVVRGDEEHMSVTLNYRYPVTRTFQECGPAVRAAFESAGFTRESSSHMEALYMAPDSPLVSALLQVYSDYTGQPATPKCIGGGTYAKMMPNTLAFGPIFPGDEVREHKPDEFMELSRLEDNAKLIARAMCRLAQ